MKSYSFLSLFTFIALYSFGEADTTGAVPPIINIDNHIPETNSGSAIESVLQIVIPVIAVVIGFLLGMSKEFFSHRRKVRRNGEGWVFTFKGLRPAIANQIIYLEDYLRKYPIESNKSGTLSIQEYLKGDSFGEYNQEYLTEYLGRYLKKDELYPTVTQMKSMVRVMEFRHDLLEEATNQLVEDEPKGLDIFRDAIWEFRNTFEKFLKALELDKSDQKEKDVIEKILKLSLDYFPESEPPSEVNMFEFEEKFGIPFLRLSQSLPENEELEKLKATLLKVSRSASLTREHRNQYNSKLEYIKRSLTNDLKVMDTIIKQLNR